MTPDIIIDLCRHAVFLAVMMVSVIIVPSLAVGLIVSLFQAATQINEQTLSFLPRLLVTLFTLSIMAPWLGSEMADFTRELLNAIPGMLG